MPVVEDVRSHWIEVYSKSLDEPEYGDHWFYFGFNSPRDVLATSSLSAMTVGVNYERRLVGGASTRIHRYFYLDGKGKLQARILPPSADWNSEYISRCVSVGVRTAVLFANATSLSNVYVFSRPDALLRAASKWTTKSFTVTDGARKVRHRASISGSAKDLREGWDAIHQSILADAAETSGIPSKGLSVKVRNGAFARTRRMVPTIV